MKYTVYVLTYLAYAMNNACRMTLAYNKPNIKLAYGLTPVHLGIIDALIYLSYGIGSFFRYYFFGGRNLTKLYLNSALCISSFFAFIPFLSIFAS
jgi:sugar phosphate permease